MELTGELFIGGERVRSSVTFFANEATSGESLQPPFAVATAEHVDRACESASAAFQSYRGLDCEVRARFLETIADSIMELGDALLIRASAESGLPIARLTGERARTCAQLRLFASEVRHGGWLGIRVDPALPDRVPAARPELRQCKVPLGPVAVFGASNFPLAFSVAGGDTASALAAGCTVVVKGHPAHPGTSELVGSAVMNAVRACGLAPGVFSLLNGESHELGTTLVRNPRIKAVGFTGSRTGGVALMKVANERAEPIPVYAEMSSINPIVLLPGALASQAEDLAKGYVASVTLGTGQFCTNPGLLFALDGPYLERFLGAAAEALQKVVPTAMLTPGIHASYEHRIQRLLQHSRVKVIAHGHETDELRCGRAALFVVDAAAVMQYPEVVEEVFGPSSIVVHCANETEMLHVLQHLEGQLTATLHFAATDLKLAQSLVKVLEPKVGRLIANAWPTGVEVSHAMVHGGPFPATSDGRSTSVGTLAIDRFLRPVCYQDFPSALLPAPLRDENFTSHPHRYDGADQVGRDDCNEYPAIGL